VDVKKKTKTKEQVASPCRAEIGIILASPNMARHINTKQTTNRPPGRTGRGGGEEEQESITKITTKPQAVATPKTQTKEKEEDGFLRR